MLQEFRENNKLKFLKFIKQKDQNAKIVKSQDDFCIVEFGASEKHLPSILRHFKTGLEEFMIESWSLSQTNLKDVFKKVVLS